MIIRTFRKMDDYRFSNGRVCEFNIVGAVWNLRLMLSRRFGFCLWRNYEPVIRFNYY